MKKILIVLLTSLSLIIVASAFAEDTADSVCGPEARAAFDEAVEAEGIEKAISKIIGAGVTSEECACMWRAAFDEAVEAEGIEKAISKIIDAGVTSEECVQCILEANVYNPYQVIKAAIMVGADLGGVVEAAKYNNISPAIISKAAVDAKAPIFGIVVAQAESSEDGYDYTPLPGGLGYSSPGDTGAGADPAGAAGLAALPSMLILGVRVGGRGTGLILYVSPSTPI